MRAKNNKKRKGDAWENFCKQYLLLVDESYSDVWLWKEIPKDVKTELRLRRKEDTGIDIVAKTKTGKYRAVQCKYRRRNKNARANRYGNRGGTVVTFDELSTFLVMCSRSGIKDEGWDMHLVMTNCLRVSFKADRLEQDQSICYDVFSAMERTDWLRLAGDYEEHTVGTTDSAAAAAAPAGGFDQDQLRQARLLRFGQ